MSDFFTLERRLAEGVWYDAPDLVRQEIRRFEYQYIFRGKRLRLIERQLRNGALATVDLAPYLSGPTAPGLDGLIVRRLLRARGDGLPKEYLELFRELYQQIVRYAAAVADRHGLHGAIREEFEASVPSLAIRLIDRYDPTGTVSFFQYVGASLTYLRGRSGYAINNGLSGGRRRFYRQLSEFLSGQQLDQTAQALYQAPLSLEKELDNGLSVKDLVAEESSNHEEKVLNKRTVSKLLKGLSHEEALLLLRRFGLPPFREHTLRQIGVLEGISEEAVRLRVNKLLQKLRRKASD